MDNTSEASKETSNYFIFPSENYTTIKLLGTLVSNGFKKFEAEIPNVISRADRCIIINCVELVELSKPWIRALIFLEREAKKMGLT